MRHVSLAVLTTLFFMNAASADEPPVGELFGAEGITFGKGGKQLLDTELWKSEKKGDTTILEQVNDPKFLRNNKTSMVINREGGGNLKNIAKIRRNFRDGSARVGTFKNTALDSLTDCERNNDKIVCYTVNEAVCKLLKEKAPKNSLNALRAALRDCGKVVGAFTSAFGKLQDELATAEKGNIETLDAANKVATDKFNFENVNARRGEEDNSHWIGLSKTKDKAVTDLFGDHGRANRYAILDICRSAFPTAVEEPAAPAAPKGGKEPGTFDDPKELLEKKGNH